MSKKVVITYLCWSNEPQKYLENALKGIAKQTYSKRNTQLLIVYNSHKEDEQSSLSFINKTVNKFDDLPRTEILEQSKNLGYVGGNNVGMQWAIDNEAKYVFLHNADGYLHKDAIEKLVDRLDSNEDVGAVQSLILLEQNHKKINCAGNNLQYLGIGYCNAYKKSIKSLGKDMTDVGYLSGAAIMMRVDLLNKYGLFEKDFHIYHDDLELSLRFRMMGYDLHLVQDSLFYHKYNFGRNKNKFYLIERNRIAFLLMYYKWPTLLLFLPAFIVMEIGMISYALLNGWSNSKFKAYGYWLKAHNISKWLKKRKRIQKGRKRSDYFLLRYMTGVIKFDDVDNIALKYIGNPILNIYFYIIKIFIFW